MKCLEKGKRNTFNIGLLLGIFVYITGYIPLALITQSNVKQINILGIVFQGSNVKAALCSFLLVSSVYLVLMYEKKGFRACIILLSISVFGSASSAIRLSNINALEGTITSACDLIVCSVIYVYIKRYSEQYRLLHQQKEEMTALYEEIAASEETLRDQNQQLEEFNTSLEEREEELNQLAYYDSLTSLPNRRMIMNHLDVLLQVGMKEDKKFSIVLVDLDDFKRINDTAGHHVGDELIRIVASRWKELVHKNDILGRIGGDEFAIIVQRPLDEEELEQYICELREKMNERVYYMNREFFVKASFGISMYPKDGNQSDLLLKYADMAMYEAKKVRQNDIQFFRSDMKEILMHNIEIDGQLQHAMQRKELYLVYQPQFNTTTHDLRGFEVLLRWKNAKFGNVAPMEFIKVAEKNGMILTMGEWVLEEACRSCMEWMNQSNVRFNLSINISVIQLLDESFVPTVKQVLKKTGYPPDLLEFEVTESTFIDSMDNAIEVLHEIKKLGIQVALDDFGTGYASLSNLQRLPIDIIKIDKSFIDSIAYDIKQKAMVQILVDTSHILKMGVVAEGIELEEQLSVLKEVECDYIQGYLWGRPVVGEQAVEFI